MLLTAPLLSKSSFFGSLVNKCRQVIKSKQQPKASNKIVIEPNDRQTNSKTTNTNNNNNIVKNDLKSTHFTNIATASISSSPSSSIDRPTIATAADSFNGSNITAAITRAASSTTISRTLQEQLGLPPRPKKPLTPYFRFLREERPKLLAENPKFKTTDVIRVLSKRWGTTDPVVKKRLQDEYKREQQEYVEVRAKYEAEITDEQREELKQLKQDIVDAKERRMMRKRVKELGRPKKPASAFLRFLVEERANNPQTAKQTYREWHKKLTEKWAKLSDKEKEIFVADARREMDAYKKEIQLWEEKMVRLGNIDVVRHVTLIDPPEPKPRVNKPVA